MNRAGGKPLISQENENQGPPGRNVRKDIFHILPGAKWLLERLLLTLTLFGGAQSHASGQNLEYHPFKFFIDPSLTETLSSAALKSRLALYVEDLNIIFSKQTIRRFVFDPERDLVITSNPPHTGYLFGPTPVSGFEIWAVVRRSNLAGVGSYGGHIDFDVSGAGVADGLYWDAIHDRAPLVGAPASSRTLAEYWKQIHHLTHEIEHIFGAGIGEYYNLRQVSDTTGLPPKLDIQYLDYAPATDSYWSRRSDYWTDPLLTWLPQLTYRELTNRVRFADVTAAILNAPVRENWLATVPDFSQTEVRVDDETTGGPIPFARVRAWKVNSSAPFRSLPFHDGISDENGVVRFAWDAQPDNSEMTLLVKAFPSDGRPPAGAWFSIFDAQEQKMVFGATNPVIQIKVPALPANSPPQILFPPDDRSVTEGESIVLHAAVTGSPPLAFQWKLNGSDFATTTNSTLTITDARLSHAGTYSISVSNPHGGVSSASASLRVVPYDSLLRFLSVTHAGSAGFDHPGGIAFDPEENLFWAASFRENGWLGEFPIQGAAGGASLAIAKFDPSGALAWLKEIRARNNAVIPSGAAADAAGNLYVTGTFTGRVDFGSGAVTGAGNEDVFVAKFSSDGDVLWVKRLGGLDFEQSGGIAAAPTGGCFVIGTFAGDASIDGVTLSAAGSLSQLFVAKLDAAGDLAWVRQSRNAAEAEGVKIAMDAQGFSLITGVFEGSMSLGEAQLASAGAKSSFLAKLDSEGRALWAIRTPGRNGGNAVASGGDGSIYLTGQNDDGELFVRKLAASGELAWAFQGGGFSNDTGKAIAVDKDGNILVGGGFLSNPAMFADSAVMNRGEEDALILKLDSNRTLLGALAAGGLAYDSIAAIAISPSGSIAVLGSFEGSADFAAFKSQSRGFQDLFLARVGTAARQLPPIIVQAPVSKIVAAGAEARFEIVAGSSSTLAFQWLKNGAPIPGATNAALIFSSAQSADNGNYSVIVKNESGSVESPDASLRVAPPVALTIRINSVANSIAIEIPTFNGLSYTLEHTEDLISASWQPAQQFSGTGEIVAVSQPISSDARYYRVREQY